MKLISIIVPVYNEEKNIPLLISALNGVFDSLQNQYDREYLFINDGSSDDSFSILADHASQDRRIKVVDFARNFTHQKAIEAGLEYATGDAVVMMDADLQHPPELIPRLIELWEQGFEIVNSKRNKTERETLLKRMTSEGFYWLMNRISHVKVGNGQADFRLLDRKAVDALKRFPENNKFYRGLVQWVGFKSSQIEYDAPERKNGTSSYTLKKMMEFARIGITSFSFLPMKIILLIGGCVTLVSLVLLVVMTCYRFFISVSYFSPLAFVVVFVLFCTGFMLMCQGIVALYLVSIYDEVRQRPRYIVRQTINIDGIQK